MEPFPFFTILFTGMAGMMSLYIFLNYLQLRDKAYLYYSLNIACIVILVALRHKYEVSYDFRSPAVAVLFAPLLQIGSHLFYFLFASSFLDLKQLLPRLFVFFRFVVAALVLYIIINIVLYYGGFPFVWIGYLFFWTRILLILIAFGSIIYAYRKPTILLRLFAIGTFLMVMSATISFVFSYFKLPPHLGLWSIPFFYFLLGYLIDIIFFTLCLGYRNRMEHKSKLQLERELLLARTKEQEERLLLVLETQQQERNRMATDLHDELGSGLSTIRFLSESLKMKNPPNSEMLNIISAKSAELIDNMRQIIWSINPEYNTLHELLLFMKKYCSEYLETNRVDWRFELPEHIPAIHLPSALRRNLFSVFKEALHNVIKHAGATRVTVSFYLVADDDQFLCSLLIADDGKGFSKAVANQYGNGLKNMRRRMQEMEGELLINDASGTTVRLNFTLSK